MAKREPPMATDVYTKLITRADALGRPERQIKERPAPPAPIMSKAEAPVEPPQSMKSPGK